MSYRIQVDDSFLAHHGVKGMKWGEWNDETKRKYGLLNAASGGGGGGDDEEDEKEPSVIDRINEYNPNTKEGRENRETMADWLIDQGVQGTKSAINQHLKDIQTGNIDRAEAQIIAIINAAAAGISGSGKGVISNPKAREMGVTYGQYADGYKKLK